MQYTPRLAPPEGGPLSDSMLQPMVNQLGWHVRWHVRRGGAGVHCPSRCRQKTILCIDDDANFCELLRRYVTGYPVQVLGAANGQHGFEQALQSRPDLIILDVMMAGLDG